MQRPIVPIALLTLTAALVACGQGATSTQPLASGADGDRNLSLIQSAKELGRLTKAGPSDTVYLIDGASAKVYTVTYKSAPRSLALGAPGLEVASVEPQTDVQYEHRTLTAGALVTLAATCGASDGPYYKNVYQGGIGFLHDFILPPSADPGGSGASAFLYGGYSTSTANVEVGFQKVYPDTTWQMYMTIRSGGRYAAPDTNGVWDSSGWKFNNVRAAGGSTINFNSRSEIGSDGQQYLITDVVSGSNTYKVGYRTGGTTTIDISSLRPSNSANIEVRKVAALAGGASLTVNSTLNLAKFRNSQYRSGTGTLVTWPNTSTSRCKTNYTAGSGTLYTKFDPSEASGSDTASINSSNTTLP